MTTRQIQRALSLVRLLASYECADDSPTLCGECGPCLARTFVQELEAPVRFTVKHVGHQVTRTVDDPWMVLDNTDPVRPTIVIQYRWKKTADRHARDLNRQHQLKTGGVQ